MFNLRDFHKDNYKAWALSNFTSSPTSRRTVTRRISQLSPTMRARRRPGSCPGIPHRGLRRRPRERPQANGLPFVVKFLLLATIFALADFFGKAVANFASLAYNAVLWCGGGGSHHHRAPLSGVQHRVVHPLLLTAKE